MPACLSALSWMPDVVWFVLFVYERTGRLWFVLVVGFLELWISYDLAKFVFGLDSHYMAFCCCCCWGLTLDLFGITLVGILIEYEAFFVSLCVKSKSPLNHIRNSCCSTLLHLKLFVFENNFFFTNQRDDKNVNSVNFKVALLPWERFLIIKTKKTNNKLTFTVNICSLFLLIIR